MVEELVSVYEGKAKILYEGPEPGTLIQHFKDDATAFNAKKHEVIEGKGVLNNRISEYLFQRLNDIGVPTHFIRRLNMREQLIREVEIIPLSVAVRNVAAGSLAKRLGIDRIDLSHTIFAATTTMGNALFKADSLRKTSKLHATDKYNPLMAKIKALG